jgi:antitoxin PrlF
MMVMAIAYSKLTAQGQISVPKEVRQRLGIGPGSVLEWEEKGDTMVVRRSGRHSSEDVHHALFETPPEPRSLEDLKDGVRKYVASRHARR